MANEETKDNFTASDLSGGQPLPDAPLPDAPKDDFGIQDFVGTQDVLTQGVVVDSVAEDEKKIQHEEGFISEEDRILMQEADMVESREASEDYGMSYYEDEAYVAREGGFESVKSDDNIKESDLVINEGPVHDFMTSDESSLQSEETDAQIIIQEITNIMSAIKSGELSNEEASAKFDKLLKDAEQKLSDEGIKIIDEQIQKAQEENNSQIRKVTEDDVKRQNGQPKNQENQQETRQTVGGLAVGVVGSALAGVAYLANEGKKALSEVPATKEEIIQTIRTRNAQIADLPSEESFSESRREFNETPLLEMDRDQVVANFEKLQSEFKSETNNLLKLPNYREAYNSYRHGMANNDTEKMAENSEKMRDIIHNTSDGANAYGKLSETNKSMENIVKNLMQRANNDPSEENINALKKVSGKISDNASNLKNHDLSALAEKQEEMAKHIAEMVRKMLQRLQRQENGPAPSQ